jgi:DNA polymerase III subunit alpha
MKSFIHLNLHSEYSLTDSIIKIPDLIANAKKHKMPAIALTDIANMFALVKFYKAAKNEGIKPIFGVDICCLGDEKNSQDIYLTLLCQNNKGLKNLFSLVSQAYQKGQIDTPGEEKKITIKKSWLQVYNEGLIVITTFNKNYFTELCLNNKSGSAIEKLKFWQNLFANRFYFGLNRINYDEEGLYEKFVFFLASTCDIPLVATNLVRFIKEEDFEALEAKVCIATGEYLTDPNRPSKYTSEQFFRSDKQMRNLFEDIPEAIVNSTQIAYRCNVTLQLGKTYLPNFTAPNDTDLTNYFLDTTKQKLDNFILKENLSQENRQKYTSRLKKENEIILKMGFASYFLIVAEFVQWSRENDIMVGPGRGSGAGSLVAYILGITNVNPLKYGLLFERFLNPERISLPDFDIDFCTAGRDKVIEHVSILYGKDKVSQIITYGRMAAKGVVRDVGRVLQRPYRFCDDLAKLIPDELGITLAIAKKNPEISKRYKEEEEVRQIWDMSEKLEGLARNVGTHAGGVLIAPSALTDFNPLYCEENDGKIISQLDKDDIEEMGLVKFDFLGLSNLSVIDRTVKIIRKTSDKNFVIDDIPTNDKNVFESILVQGNTIGIFQLESDGIKVLMKKLKPSVFEDIVALVALYRPGPLNAGMADDYVDCKHGNKKIIYPHHLLEDVLKETYGTIIYQEQVMQIAQILANYSLGEADILRRAMGKKKKEEMASQREKFIQGAVANGITQKKATDIFNDMEKFAEYGFNKSHSVAYAMIAWQTAYLKHHYSAIFMAEVLTSDKGVTKKLAPIVKECKSMGLKILSPCINESFDDFYAIDDKSIRYGLGAIKGVGSRAIGKLISEREQNGAYKNIDDFLVRNLSFVITKAVVESLICAGCFDSCDAERDVLFNNMANIIRSCEQEIKNKQSGQVDLFDGGEKKSNLNTISIRPNTQKWHKQEFLRQEKKFLDLYLSGHPFSLFKSIFANLNINDIATITEGYDTASNYNRKKVMVVGFITDIRKKGSLMFVGIDDKSCATDIMVTDNLIADFREKYKENQLLLCNCYVSYDKKNNRARLSLDSLVDVDNFLALSIQKVIIHLKQENINKISQLKQIIESYKGKVSVAFCIQTDKGTLKQNMGASYAIEPRLEFFVKLQNILGWGCMQCF